jgi:hypothetical protein
VRIWTAQRTYITALRHSGKFAETRSGFYGQPSGQRSPFPVTSGARATGAKRVSNMTDEQKGAAAERMAQYPDLDVVRPANCLQAIGL